MVQLLGVDLLIQCLEPLGPSDFLGKLTYAVVAIWLILSLLLAYLLKTENSEVIFDTPLIEEVKEEELSDEIPLD